MAETERRRRLARLFRRQLFGWAVAWLIGVSVFAAWAVSIHGKLGRQDLDAELRLVAMAVYGLTWIDEHGAFHQETLLREPELTEPFDVWVVAPEGLLLEPQRPRFHGIEIQNVARGVLGSEPDDYFRDGVDPRGRSYRLHGIVTYDERDDPAAAILVLADPGPWSSAHSQFLQQILFVAALLAVAGLGVGAWLSRRALRPVLTSFQQQERFLAAAAHELRTPVASLQAVCEAASGDGQTAEERLGQIRRLVSRASRLVGALLLHARLEAQLDSGSAPTPVRLDLLVESVLPEDGSVALDAQESVVHGDPALLETAIRNLVENALLHGKPKDDDLETGVKVTVNGSEITVEDRGPGFAPEVLVRATEAFVSRSDSPGTGLGLAIVRRIAERHGGDLRFQNRPNGGARVTFSLPGH